MKKENELCGWNWKKVKMYGWDKKEVVGHSPKLKTMQIKWDRPKWKML